MSSKKQSKPINFTLATETSPALTVGNNDKERRHLTTVEFKQQLTVLANESSDLIKMGRRLGQNKNKAITLADGSSFGPKDLTALDLRHKRKMRQLSKNFSAGSRRKKPTGVKKEKKGDGFAHGAFLRPELIAFIQNSNFGTLGGPSGKGASIKAELQDFLERGILSRSIMTILLTIYEFANGHRFEEDGKKYFSAGPEMREYLGDSLSAVERKDAATSDKDMIDAKGNPKLRFKRDKFVYNRLQSVANPGIYLKKDLNDEQIAYLNNPQVQNSLKETQEKLSNTLKIWNPKK